MLLFPAAYVSFQNLVTLVIPDRLMRFTYRFVVLFFTLEVASLSLFWPFLACLISDLPSTFLNVKQNNKVGKPTWRVDRSAFQKSSSTHDQTHGYQKKTHTTCKRWMLLSKLQRCYNNIIYFLLYHSCIKKMINPSGRRVFCCNLYNTTQRTTFGTSNLLGFCNHCWVFRL